MNRLLCLSLCALLLLTACAVPQTPEEEAWQVYYTTASLGTAALAAESRPLPEGAAPVDGLLRLLLAGPQSPDLISPIPPGTRLLGWSQGEDGLLTVDLSERYGGLAGVELTLADYAIALTLCQLPQVEAVSITVEGEPVSFRAYDRLRPSDIILSGAEDAPVYVTAQLWFPGPDRLLHPERRELLITENDDLAGVLVEALMAGPETEALSPAAPQSGELLSAEVENGICYVNFSSAFAQGAPAEQREAGLQLYAIVNTLCAQESIQAVQLLVDGAAAESYGGVPISAPLEANLELQGGETAP